MKRPVIFALMLAPCVLLLFLLIYWRIHLPVPAPPTPADNVKVVIADSSLTDAERQDFYHFAEGSEVYPLDWVRVLQDSTTGKPFLDNMERFGFIADDRNPDRLPIGLTGDTVRGLEPLGRMVGINCAACHVGALQYKNVRLRIDGAPNVVNTRLFFKSLVESAQATLENPVKLAVFVTRLCEQRLGQKAPPALQALADKAAAHFDGVFAPLVKKLIDKEQAIGKFDLAKLIPDAKKPDAVRKRLLEGYDASDFKTLLDKAKPLVQKIEQDLGVKGKLESAVEELFIGIRLVRSRKDFLERLAIVGTTPNTDWGPGRVDAFGSARAFLFQKGYGPTDAVSYPHLWGMADFNWYHWDGNTTSILERNFGQALGVGAVYDRDSYASTLRPLNLHRLEMLGGKIKAPKWPEDLLGKIDPKSVQRGAALFKKQCSDCHPPFQAGTKDSYLPKALDEIKTDPNRAKMFAATLPADADAPFQSMFFPDAIALAMSKIKDKAMKELTPDEQQVFKNDPKAEWRGPGMYVGRPLVAIWATAPYLHNGSVPTLDDLLQPKRPPTFPVGHRDFDPIKLGLTTDVKHPIFMFDTSKPGNDNTGHVYGTTLSPADRKDLLEYLKAN